MKLNKNNVKQAFLYLKNYIYYDNLNLFLKQNIAEFESTNCTNDKLESKFEEIAEEIVTCANFDNLNECNRFQTWLNQIDFYILPKQIESFSSNENSEEKEKGLFICNVREKESYKVSKINYFIKAPVALHIIDTLWCLYVGPVLESMISKDNYGNRMSASALQYRNIFNIYSEKNLFIPYIKKYTKWRDQAVQTATEISEKKENVAILSLDLTSYFYHINLDFNKINSIIELFYEEDKKLLNLAKKLNFLLEKIYNKYYEQTKPFLRQTHLDCEGKKGLPIGLASSAIIGNWYLSDFDQAISETVNPVYYGRYVDDILIVIKNINLGSSTNPINTFIDKYFKEILCKTEKGDYSIRIEENELPIQKDKLILQFYDKDYSRAGLEIFKKELDERSSAFKFLPSEHINKELEQFAYDVLYNGSTNKLRSIVGIAENDTELAKYLASHIMAHRLCKIDDGNKILNQIKLFFKGKNALQFFRLWEKIFQYAIIIKKDSFTEFFYNYINKEISKIKFKFKPKSKKDTSLAKQIEEKIKDSMRKFNKLSLGITAGLKKIDNMNQYPDLVISEYAHQFRKANLVRHHLVAWPLLNYTDCQDDLTDEKNYLISFENLNKQNINSYKVEYSPRFIHFDEWQLFNLKKIIFEDENQMYKWITDELSSESKNLHIPIPSKNIKMEEESDINNIKKYKLTISDNYNKSDKICIAIANINIDQSDIYSAIRKDKTPNLSFDRQEKLYFLLNSALKERADILILPEVSIPVSWLPFMVSFSRRHQIGLIFGLEHWVLDNRAYNLLIETLPFRNSDQYKTCIMTARIKNHYAPAELDCIKNVRLIAGKPKSASKVFYHKVLWRGVAFATYNCFELSDINHRVIFKSEIDLLIACVWNKDTNYYQHILESTVRDLHCYTVQANTSQYGGSCVLRPTRTENKTMLYVKGGDNVCILTTHLDVKKLREFQYKNKPSSEDEFKHLPPGYDCEGVLSR